MIFQSDMPFLCLGFSTEAKNTPGFREERERNCLVLPLVAMCVHLDYVFYRSENHNFGAFQLPFAHKFLQNPPVGMKPYNPATS